VQGLHGLADVDWFARRVTELLPSLVPAEVTVYAEIDLRAGAIRFNQEALDALAWPEALAVFTRHARELPLYSAYRRGAGSAAKISDYLSPRQFERTAIYNEFYRPLGVRHHMAKGLPGPPGVIAGIGVLRAARDFAERDRVILDLLRPHLNHAYENARAVGELREELALLRDGLEAVERGLIALTASGRPAVISGRAFRLLERYVGPVKGDRLPASIAAWLAAQAAPPGAGEPPRVPTALIVDAGDRRLVVRQITQGGARFLLLTEEVLAPRPEALEPLGLSRREAEVLAWLAEGKANAEIATILGISARTVDKHLERIYQKLGVEGRTAAVAVALSALARA
jgi:DNA-binding CsgD family transcriptional regulator